MEIGDKKKLVRISDLVEIWFELAFQLDLKCGENLKNYCKKITSCQIKYNRP